MVFKRSRAVENLGAIFVFTAKVESVVLNALAAECGLPPDMRAFGDGTPIVFGEADPPLTHMRGRAALPRTFCQNPGGL